MIVSLFASICLVVSPASAACPPKPGKPCLNPLPPKGPRTGPIIIPTQDKFATQAEYRAALKAYRDRSSSDLSAGLISQKTHDAELKSIQNATGKLNAAH
jgi:hypothetical protein